MKELNNHNGGIGEVRNTNNKFGRLQSTIFTFGMILVVFLSTNAVAQTNTWKTTYRDQGRIKVQYFVSERTNEEGNKVPWIKYTAVAIAKINVNKSIVLFSDPTEYGKLIGLETCEKIKSISDNEWVNYSTASPGWPIADFDWVARMTFSKNANTRTVKFTSTAEPDFIERTKFKRITFDNESYTFKDLGNGEIEITINLEETPAVKVPGWLLKMAVPGNAADLLRKIIKYSKLNEEE